MQQHDYNYCLHPTANRALSVSSKTTFSELPGAPDHWPRITCRVGGGSEFESELLSGASCDPATLKFQNCGLSR